MQIPLTEKAAFLLQECSVFLFEKRCAEKLHKPKRKETVTEILRSSVRQLERFRHPKILHVLHPIEECAETLAFASEPVFASLANILAHQEGSGNHGGITATGASQQPAVRSAYAREYNFLDIEYKYGILQASEGGRSIMWTSLLKKIRKSASIRGTMTFRGVRNGRLLVWVQTFCLVFGV